MLVSMQPHVPSKVKAYSMKHLTILITFLMAVGSQANALETVMACGSKAGEKLYFKHIKPLVGVSTVKYREKGRWGVCPLENKDYYQPPKFEVYKSGAMAVTYELRLLDNSSNEELGIPLGTPLRKIRTEVLDFEFGVRTTDTSLDFIDSAGNYVTTWKLKEWVGEKTYTCEIQK